MLLIDVLVCIPTLVETYILSVNLYEFTLSYILLLFIPYILAIGTAVTCAGESDVFAFAAAVPINDPGPLQPLLDSLKTSLQSHTSVRTSTHNTSLKACSPSTSSTAVASSTSTPPLSLLDLLSHTTPPSSSSTTTSTSVTTSLPSKVENKTGLLLTNKFTNLPLPLIAPLHKNLYDDILWIKSSQENYSDDTNKPLTENLKNVENWRNFEYLLLLLPIELTSPNKDIINNTFKQYTNMIPYTYIKNLSNNNNHINIIYQYFEDEILAQNSGFRTESLSVTESSSPPSDSSTTTSSNMYIWRSSSTSSGGSSASSSGDSILKSNSIYMVSVIHINEYKKSIGEIETLIG